MMDVQFTLSKEDGHYTVKASCPGNYRVYISYSSDGFSPRAGAKEFTDCFEFKDAGSHRPFFYIFDGEGKLTVLSETDVSIGDCMFEDAGGRKTQNGAGYVSFGKLYFADELKASEDSVELVRELGIETIADMSDTASPSYRKDIQYDGVRMLAGNTCGADNGIFDKAFFETVLRSLAQGDTVLIHGGPGYESIQPIKEALYCILGCSEKNEKGTAVRSIGISDDILGRIRNNYIIR